MNKLKFSLVFTLTFMFMLFTTRIAFANDFELIGTLDNNKDIVKENDTNEDLHYKILLDKETTDIYLANINSNYDKTKYDCIGYASKDKSKTFMEKGYENITITSDNKKQTNLEVENSININDNNEEEITKSILGSFWYNLCHILFMFILIAIVILLYAICVRGGYALGGMFGAVVGLFIFMTISCVIIGIVSNF